MPYVVTEPESIRGVYDSWAECQAKVAGASGVRYQKVKNHEEAEAMLAGAGVVLPPGLYAFPDGNNLGGVGVVIVRVAEDESAETDVVQEIATSVGQIFGGAAFSGLESEPTIADALRRLTNILAEIAGLYAALGELPEGVEVTIVHDYEGVGAFMQEGRWRANDPILRAVVSASQELAERKKLRLRFLHQRGRMSTWAGRHDPARFNALADALAAQGGKASAPKDVS
jgi:ribonuclease HI